LAPKEEAGGFVADNSFISMLDLAMNKWLQNFAYRVEINIWTFVLSALIALLIALATISYQAVKATVSNPVDSLRYE